MEATILEQERFHRVEQFFLTACATMWYMRRMGVRNLNNIFVVLPVTVFLAMTMLVMMPVQVFAVDCRHCQSVAAQAPDCCMGDMEHAAVKNAPLEATTSTCLQEDAKCYHRGGQERHVRYHSAHSIDVFTPGTTLSLSIGEAVEKRRHNKPPPPLLLSFSRHILYCSYLI